MKRRTFIAGLGAATLAAPFSPCLAATGAREPDILAPLVRDGLLPPLAERLPTIPRVMPLDARWQTPGRHGGDLRMLMARARDTRIIRMYGYARMLTYTPEYQLEPDIPQRIDVDDGGRTFTFHLRPGHRWSDGAPLTSEDFRYYWDDVLMNGELRPMGPPTSLLVDGEPPIFTVIDPLTLRYSWTSPHPTFLGDLAGPRPELLVSPAHYLRRFHPSYADAKDLAESVEDSGRRTWAALHNAMDNDLDGDNPDLPTLQPWVPVTRAPANRFLFERNPYFHRVDPQGLPLPYIDRITMTVCDQGLVPAKSSAGDTDLQARYLAFTDYPVLKQGEEREGYRTSLWREGSGAALCLFPNLNTNDPVWRALLRDIRFRRALSLAMDREEINEVVYFGLAHPSNNTVTPDSPLWRPAYQTTWATHDPALAADLLDGLGLKRRLGGGRTLPDGRPLDIIVESAGSAPEETDVLELIADSWREVGVRLFTKTIQIEVLRNRIYAGDTVMSIANGLNNGVASASMPPRELAPLAQDKYQWPKWGQFHETAGRAGEEPDMPEARRLLALYDAWRSAQSDRDREVAWREMLDIHASEQFTLGTVNATLQPVVSNKALRNTPETGVYCWNPGAQLGIYNPDCFWFEGAIEPPVGGWRGLRPGRSL
ncbi:MAG: ABC transporter substrate-binding protein [Rhodospirillum sp.]|nr:ABC transporter substrate-binding protein [Rhodospirillum sp.]MCF8489565.1 ABC transporter substrate-binding protein [Rhodospirillum sp.]